jgi:hypothetical protein
MKFYMKRNAGRPLQVGDTQIVFTICEQAAGTWFGVFKTDVESEIELLDQAVKAKDAFAIDENAYNKRMKMRKQHRPGSTIESAGVSTRGQPAPVKAADVESVTTVTPEVSEADMTATTGLESKEGDTYAKNLVDLADALGMSNDDLVKLRALDGCPKSTGKGYHVATFQEFIAAE